MEAFSVAILRTVSGRAVEASVVPAGEGFRAELRLAEWFLGHLTEATPAGAVAGIRRVIEQGLLSDHWAFARDPLSDPLVVEWSALPEGV